MSSIYDTIAVWVEGDFVKNDIREYPANSNQYWYSLKDDTGNAPPTVGSVQWGGRTTFAIQSASNTTNVPEFIWTPSYNESAEISPRVLAVRFGDGYTQRTPDGINNNL